MTHKDARTPMFIAALLSIAKTGTTEMSINRGVDREDVVPIHNGILLGH